MRIIFFILLLSLTLPVLLNAQYQKFSLNEMQIKGPVKSLRQIPYSISLDVGNRERKNVTRHGNYFMQFDEDGKLITYTVFNNKNKPLFTEYHMYNSDNKLHQTITYDGYGSILGISMYTWEDGLVTRRIFYDRDTNIRNLTLYEYDDQRLVHETHTENTGDISTVITYLWEDDETCKVNETWYHGSDKMEKNHFEQTFRKGLLVEDPFQIKDDMAMIYHEYDEEGRKTLTVCLLKGKEYGRISYYYTVDPHNNWIKEVSILVNNDNEKVTTEIERTFEYY